VKRAFHCWWNEVSDRINLECALHHDFVRAVKAAFKPWARYALEKAHLKRIENVTRENQSKFNRLMEETEQQAQELIALEKARQKKMEEEAKQLIAEEKARRIEDSKRKLANEKEKDRLLLLDVQTEMRRRRVSKELKAMKKKFKERWAVQTEIELAKAKDRITAYINNKDNKLAIDMKFEAAKRQVRNQLSNNCNSNSCSLYMFTLVFVALSLLVSSSMLVFPSVFLLPDLLFSFVSFRFVCFQFLLTLPSLFSFSFFSVLR
jgi:uncharacterized protein (DUF2132 family)